MKLIVNLMQLLIIAVLIYPFFYLWETDKIEKLCDGLAIGMSAEDITAKADQYFLKWHEKPLADTEKWHLQIISRASFAGFSCDIKGMGKKMSSARIIEDADTP
ncbi:MAG TPA: hypothetical protein VFM76_06785 [Methylophaga sp.]|nr:hypothetical protein [Methylophaga sp.]